MVARHPHHGRSDSLLGKALRVGRRAFAGGMAGAFGSSVLSGCAGIGVAESASAGSAAREAEGATGKVVLGQSGLSVPRLAMGTGSGGWKRASDQTRLGRREFVRLMKYGAERGASFIDAADLYGSHEYVKAALGELRRDEVTLLTKVWFQEAPRMTPTRTARPEVERFMKELGTDWLDIVLIHSVTDPAWPSELARMRDELSELKAKGIVRSVGCSCHSHAALAVAAHDPWVDVILARINPGKKRMDEDASVAQVARTLKLARKNGKGVVGMKLYGAGEWQSPSQRKRSLSYAVEHQLVDAMTIGHMSAAQLDDTVENLDEVLARSPRAT